MPRPQTPMSAFDPEWQAYAREQKQAWQKLSAKDKASFRVHQQKVAEEADLLAFLCKEFNGKVVD